MKRQRGFLALPVAIAFVLIFGLLFDNWWVGIAMFFAFQGTKKKA